MDLIMSPASPFARKVRVLIREVGLDHHVNEVDVATTPLVPDAKALAANPTGKIPALIRNDGPAIYDSRVICRYLNARAGSSLYPEEGLWEVLTLEATADAMMDAAVAMVYQARFVATDGASGDWIEAQWSKVAGALNAIDARWMSHLAGPLNAAQIAVGSGWAYLDFRHGARDWRDDVPALADWFVGFAERTSMRDTAPPAG